MKTKDKFVCFDNGGETLDRYTILETKTGELWGCSDMPFHPLGFGQYCGNVANNYWNIAYGYGWQRGCSSKVLNKRIRFAVEHFLADCAHIGKIVPMGSLPNDVITFISQRQTETV